MGVFVKFCTWCFKENVGSLEGAGAEKLPHLTPSQKRRLTSLGATVVTQLCQAQYMAGADDMIFVTSSRYGDGERMLRLLQQIGAGELLSPTDFSFSVHNALVGFFSILKKNENGHFALSGGKKSFAQGLIAAYALCKDKKEDTAYTYYDDPLPSPYDQVVCREAPPAVITMILSPMKDFPTKERSISLNLSKDPAHFFNDSSIDIPPLIQFFKSESESCIIPISGGSLQLQREGT